MSLIEEMHEGTPEAVPIVESELAHVREQVSLHEAMSSASGVQASKEQIVSKVINEYAEKKPEEVLPEHAIIENPKFEEIVRTVDALPHREKIRELYAIMQEKGILNAIKIAQGLNNPHVEEDFHHVLVHYIHTGSLIPGLDKEKEVKQELTRTVFEIVVPLQKEQGQVDPQQVLLSMQRFLAGIFGQGGGGAQYAFEIALANFSSDITCYITVPDEQKDLFLKQFLGNFPTARATQVLEDYNVFNEFGFSAVAVGRHEKRFAYTLALPTGQMESLSPILAAFSNIAHQGEAAAIQYIVTKDDRDLLKKTRGAIGKINSGQKIGDATNIPLTMGGDALKFIGGLFGGESEKPKEVSPEEQERRSREIKVIEEKTVAPFLRVDLRIVVSSGDKERTLQILNALIAAFGQFANRESSGGLRFDVMTKGSAYNEELHAFNFRISSPDALVLNHNEFAALFHPALAITASEAPNLASIKSAAAPPPAQLPSEGTLLGESVYRGIRKPVRMTAADRLRHLYVIGQTGTGKTTILKNMIIEDIKAGHGACFIDPHGSDVQDILANIPKERIDDVIYFDPSYTPRPFGLNMLEYDESKPEQKIFVVNELLAIFKKLYAASPESMGPAFEQYFRNATMLVMEDPETGSTMLDITRVLVDPKFRELKLSRCKNPIVTQFWKDIATKSTGDASLANMVPYITNKFDVFIANDVMRPIIAQQKSSFNFREVMDGKKILLVNLAKGKLGEMNANLLGMIIVGKLFLAAMSRVDSYGIKLPDFYLYIDEFQNISTPSIAGILSEARKYGLSLNIAHQFIAQIDNDIKDAVFGNVGSMAVFRISADDAQYLESQFAPTFTATDLMKIESRNCYLKPLINGTPVAPFNIAVYPPSKGVPQIVEQLQQLSYMKYGKDRAIVDTAIVKKYQDAANTAAAAQAKPAVTAPPVQAQRPIPPPLPQPPVQSAVYQPQYQQMQQQYMPQPTAHYPQQMQHPPQGYVYPPQQMQYVQQPMPPQYVQPPQAYVPHGNTAPYMYPPVYPQPMYSPAPMQQGYQYPPVQSQAPEAPAGLPIVQSPKQDPE
ncbi:MAG TPA: TraM recognition domain-containing protein [Candidatus Paceibacterota bacterium]|nr:TraM recognition domain-containing protein [Candidatus Paceibacterota bacterium]